MDFQTILAEMRDLGGEIYGVCSQGREGVDRAKESWSLDFPMVSDPQVIIGEELYKRGLLDIYVDAEFADSFSKISGGRIAGGDYAVGTYQPAVMVLAKDFSPLFSWASVPTASNIGGAVGRPWAKDVSKAIKAGLQGNFSFVNWQAPKTPKELPSQYFQYLYLALCLAHGNFVRPFPFPLDENGRGAYEPQMQKAFGKLIVFIGALGVIIKLSRPRPQIVFACAAAYSAYIKLVWGPHIQNLWKTGGSDASKNLLFRRRLNV